MNPFCNENDKIIRSPIVIGSMADPKIRDQITKMRKSKENFKKSKTYKEMKIR